MKPTHFKKKPLKYRNVRTNYGGYNYDSKLEASMAEELDWRVKAKEVKSWTRQHRFDFVVNGVSITKSYKIDFRAERTDGAIEYIESKGLATEDWKIKWELTQALFEDLTKGEVAILKLHRAKQGTRIVLRNALYVKKFKD